MWLFDQKFDTNLGKLKKNLNAYKEFLSGNIMNQFNTDASIWPSVSCRLNVS